MTYPPHTFASEILLQQAIAGLLTRMPDVTGVQILQGPQELGKDLIFFIPGAFKEPLLCACVVKNKRITGDASRSGGARTILNQAQQAFDSAHTDSFGKEIRIERVYVVTPYNLSPTTISSIKGRLQERAGQVVFLDGSVLFDLFKQYWPDYFADEASALERHMRLTNDLIEDASPLDELAVQYGLGLSREYDKKIYVAQGFYRKVHWYTLGKLITDGLPSTKDIFWRMKSKDVQVIRTKTNTIARLIQKLNDWQFCSNEDRERFALFAERLSSTLGVHLEQEYPKAGKKKSRKKLQQKAQEKIDFISPAREQLTEILNIRESVLARIETELDNLKSTLATREFRGLQVLSDEGYLKATFLDDFVRSFPEGFFQSHGTMEVEFPKDIFSGWDGHLMIVGAPGYGKTSFCRWHALSDAESFNTKRSNTIPVYVPLSRFSRESVGSFEDSILSSLGKSALVATSSIKAKTRVRIYLDGLDEITSPERRKEVIRLSYCAAKQNQRYQIILTSRDYIYEPWLEWLPRITLGGLERSGVLELAEKWLGKESESVKKFNTELNGLPMLVHLMRTPLLATLVIMVFRQTSKLPESKTRLYEIFTSLLSGGWDLAKGVLRKSKFGEHDKIMVLSTLAGFLHEQKRTEFDSNDVKKAVQEIFSWSIGKYSELLQQEFVIDGLVARSGGVMQFSHLSFQEFLAAKNFMGTPQATRINQALEAYLWGDGWWKEVIRFYIGLSSNPTSIKHWLISRLRQFQTVGLAEISTGQVQELLSAIAERFPGRAKRSVEEAQRVISMSQPR